MQTKNLLYILPVSAMLLLGACTPQPEGTEKEKEKMLSQEQKKFASIKTSTLQRRLISSVIACTGEIEVPPQGIAAVTAPLGGYIVDTDIVPGAYVKKGNVLATLSNPEYIVLQQSYLETSSQLKFAEQDFQRQKTLQEQNATAVKKLQESESTYTVLKARLAGLKAQLKLIGIDLANLEGGNIQSVVTLRAPITGYITNVNHHPGEFVEPREAIFEVVNMSELHLHLNVFEHDISQVQKGQDIRFHPTGEDNGYYLGRVSLISPKRSTEVRSFDVHAHIETGEDKLKPGMYVEAEIMISADTVYALPEDATVFSENKWYVVAEEKGQYAVYPVEIGARMDGWVEIRNYEAFGNKSIVTEGASRLFTALRREKKQEGI